MNDVLTYTFNYEELVIDPGDLEHLMGYSQPGSCPAPVVEMIHDILDRAPMLCDIKGGMLITEPVHVDRENRMLKVGQQTFETGKIVTNQLRNSEKAAWFICTAGEKLPDYSRILMEQGDIMEGYVVDVAGNTIVERAMDKMMGILKEDMLMKGLKITNRYSPGYCEWNITEQQKLFSLFPENYLGVHLTDTCLMQPIKTVSGVIGIGKSVKLNPYTCNYCTQANCLYRDK